MTLLPNGRPATQSDIAGLRQHLDDRLDDIDKRWTDHEVRLRALELDEAREQGAESATEAAQQTQQDIKSESAESRRWLVGISIAVGLSLLANFIALVRA